MILKVYSVYDLKACAFMQPFFSVNAGSAMRAFGDEVQKPDSHFAKHSGDFQLFELGTWDDNTGHLETLLPMKLLCSGGDFSAPSYKDMTLEQKMADDCRVSKVLDTASFDGKK